MENRESSKRVLYTMLLVNGFILTYYLAVTSASKKIICDMNGAYTFLSVAEGIPADTVTLCLKTFALYGALSVLILIKEDVCRENKMNLHLASVGEKLDRRGGKQHDFYKYLSLCDIRTVDDHASEE